MTSPAPPSGQTASTGLRLGLLWLAGMDLRITLLAVAPLLPLIRTELQLDEKRVAILATMPVLLFGLAAVPGSLLVARVGALRVLLIGLTLLAVSSALRGAGGSAPMLFAMTFVMGVGIAISQPAMPALVRQWFPGAVARATGVWSNGFLMGEMLGAALPLAVLLALVGGRWELVLTFITLPVFVTLLFMVLAVGRVQTRASHVPTTGWPDWRQARTWQLGGLQSSSALVYFGANTFLPDYLHLTGQPDLVGPALTLLNFSQVPASVVIGLLPRRLLSHRGLMLLMGGLVLAGLPGLLSDQAPIVLVSVSLLGFASAVVLVVCLALPALLAAEEGVARLAAGAATIGYSITFVSNVAAGALWDATHVAASGFLPVLAGAAIVLALGPLLVAARADGGMAARR